MLTPAFAEDLAFVQQALVQNRMGHFVEGTGDMVSRLTHFVECVLASSISWDGKGKTICQTAALLAEFLSICNFLEEDDRAHMRFRSAMLYEIAQRPVLSASTIQDKDSKDLVVKLFKRKGPFGSFHDSFDYDESIDTHESFTVAELSLMEDAINFARYAHGMIEEERVSEFVSNTMGAVAKSLSIGLSSTELLAFSYILKNRLKLTTRAFANDSLLDKLQMTNFPVELWPPQVEAINGGLLDPQIDAWGLAAPTGTGKTSLTRLLILKTLESKAESKIIYVVPSKALVYEVTNNLSAFLNDLQVGVIAISPQLVELDSEERGLLDEVSVIVLTPEKADLLLRLGETFFKNTSLVIIDEAHHIESGTRGLLLEMYLWRLKKLIKSQSRFVFLSAVTPNIGDITTWMGRHSGEVTINERSTRMRVGVYRVERSHGEAKGCIYYPDNMKLCVVDKNASNTIKKGIVQLAEAIAVWGPVLIVASGKKTCENLAQEMLDLLKKIRKGSALSDEELNSAPIQRLDSRLEREMYSTVGMRELLKYRIAYHHAGLPPRVRVAVEDAIREKKIDYVFATTTLAEGVNFPFSTVIVQSLVLRDPPEKGKPATWQTITPRTFWNIAGRAGRPGFDTEGQVILFEQSLGVEKSGLDINEYLNPSLVSIQPVNSSLVKSVQEIQSGLEAKEFSLDMLGERKLPEELPKRIKGAVNILRSAVTHIKASKLTVTAEELAKGTFAYNQLDESQQLIMKSLVSSQVALVDDLVEAAVFPPIELIARLGLSIETIFELRDYIIGLGKDHLRNMKNVMYGGRVNISQARYIVGPVAKRMAELEGTKLGGFLSDTIMNWITGLPLAVIHEKVNSDNRKSSLKSLEDLINVIYSRVQFLLPWGLYAADSIIQAVAGEQDIPYENEVRSLARLADAGVPNFDALRLVGLEFERVDATRLSFEYYRRGGTKLGVDIVSWLVNLPIEQSMRIIRGMDGRKIDYDFVGNIESLRQKNIG